jgi:DNA-binding NtrC family response regulator
VRATVILLADNDHEFLETRSEFFQQAGFTVKCAYSLDEAVRVLEQGDLDIAILDMRLLNDEDDKDFSGLELAAQVAPAIPKIILTRYPSYEAVKQALAPQLDGLPPAVDFLAKQDGSAALVTAVRRALAKRVARRRTARTILTSNPPMQSALNLSTDVRVLRQLITKRLDLEELRTLCFDLEVDFDSLRGEGKAGKSRELVALFWRRGVLDQLRVAVERVIESH